nr:copia protein [Tanacetum cinerariifolium]
MFDLDYLTNSMNYELVLVENQANKSAGPKKANNSVGTQANEDQGANSEEIDLNEEHFVLPIWSAYSTTVKSSGDKIEKNTGFKTYDPSMPHLEDIYASPSEGIFTNSSYDDEGVKAIRTKWVYKNKKDERGVVFRNKARLVSQGHRQEEGIDYDEVFAHVARIEAIRIFLAFASYMGFILYQMDVKSAFLYGMIDEEVYVLQPPGFIDLKFPNKVYKVVKALYGLHQALRDCVRTASTPIKTQKPLAKDEEAADVDTSHFQDVKRIFRYLKGQPKLGLWYPKVSSFDLEAYSDSDYAGVNLDKNPQQEVVNFLAGDLSHGNTKSRLLWLLLLQRQNIKELASPKQTTLGKDISNPLMAGRLPKTTLPTGLESSICRTLKSHDAESTSCLANADIFDGLAKMGYEKLSEKLTFYKALFSTQWKFLIHTILQCLSAKTTSWNEFSSTMASTIICLDTNQKFNFSSGKNSMKLKESIDSCTHLSNKVLEIESEVIDIKSAYKERIENLEGRLDKLEEENKVLKELNSVHSKVDTAAPVVKKEKSFKQGRIISDIDEDDVDDEEPADVEEVLDVVKAAKLITEVVTTAGATTTVEATKVSVPRRKRRVVIQDPEETTSTVVMHSEVQSKDKGKALKRKSLTEAQARKNMIIYLKNMAGYKINYFKGMTYSEIRPLFKKHYNYNQAFLEEVNEEVTLPEKKVKVEAHKREGEILEKEITKKQKMDKEAEELRSHLQIISNDDDDVYTKATPLASKIPIVDYKIHLEETNLTSR